MSKKSTEITPAGKVQVTSTFKCTETIYRMRGRAGHYHKDRYFDMQVTVPIGQTTKYHWYCSDCKANLDIAIRAEDGSGTIKGLYFGAPFVSAFIILLINLLLVKFFSSTDYLRDFIKVVHTLWLNMLEESVILCIVLFILLIVVNSGDGVLAEVRILKSKSPSLGRRKHSLEAVRTKRFATKVVEVRRSDHPELWDFE